MDSYSIIVILIIESLLLYTVFVSLKLRSMRCECMSIQEDFHFFKEFIWDSIIRNNDCVSSEELKKYESEIERLRKENIELKNMINYLVSVNDND